ncbi:hypothetical protein R4K48_13365, partial [Brachyspira pulli]
ILTDHCQLHFVELPKFNLKNISAIESLDNIHKEFISWVKFFKGENMSNLIKENTIFEEVEKKCRTFVNDSPVMDKYKKREVDTYFFNKSMELDIKKAKEEGIKENQIIIARNLKKSGLDIKFISDNTGLSIEEIEKL